MAPMNFQMLAVVLAHDANPHRSLDALATQFNLGREVVSMALRDAANTRALPPEALHLGYAAQENNANPRAAAAAMPVSHAQDRHRLECSASALIKFNL
ncbi:hypothetical protein H257_01585 [Aphanomyces astaci]|uniref:Uncharacterized protein n=1 Tax=Aphanomyces astaci TaxID=112090 RepID=W4HB01_APHAT|nr:hypothetical protein H257_01585 [Aphanomyces astaci]ETV88293.1 hypothetical protein H257_01585 [Aphanomyces astaci]|eukprot:XP_009823156.1 hypothetical protein H257_01585 [Aphanomyces astaci]